MPFYDKPLLRGQPSLSSSATCRYPEKIKGGHLIKVQLYLQALTGEFVSTLLAQIDKNIRYIHSYVSLVTETK